MRCRNKSIVKGSHPLALSPPPSILGNIFPIRAELTRSDISVARNFDAHVFAGAWAIAFPLSFSLRFTRTSLPKKIATGAKGKTAAYGIARNSVGVWASRSSWVAERRYTNQIGKCVSEDETGSGEIVVYQREKEIEEKRRKQTKKGERERERERVTRLHRKRRSFRIPGKPCASPESFFPSSSTITRQIQSNAGSNRIPFYRNFRQHNFRRFARRRE